MTELSPEAQAVRDAFFNGPDDFMASIAAALRAVADQVAPNEPDYMRNAIHDQGWWDKQDLIRAKILAIADELDPESHTP